MKKDIGKIKVIPIREAFPHEAHDFTVWLSQNIDALAEKVGFPLIVESREVSVGKFRADLVCLDGSGNRVIIENQLEQTDHDHLGKLMTYMGNLNANTAIWITAQPRIEHQTAIENFNAQKRFGFAFYLVKVEAISINNSIPAPLFTVISRPEEESAPVFETEVERYTLDEANITSELKSPKTKLPPVWCIFPRRDKAVHDLFFESHSVGLGFSNLGDLRKLPPNREAFKAAFSKGVLVKLFYPKRTINILYSMIYRFVHEAEVGDLIIYPPTWIERVIHVGRIKSDYYYLPKQPQGYTDLRNVDWIGSFSRDSFTTEALKGISVNLAFFQIRNQAFLTQLEDKLKVS